MWITAGYTSIDICADVSRKLQPSVEFRQCQLFRYVTACLCFLILQFYKLKQKIAEFRGANSSQLMALVQEHGEPADTFSGGQGGYRLGGGSVPSQRVGPPPPVQQLVQQQEQPDGKEWKATAPGRKLNDPSPAPGSVDVQDPQQVGFVSQLLEMGFSQSQAERAYTATKGNLEAAVDWCVSHPDEQGHALGGTNAPPDQRPIPGATQTPAQPEQPTAVPEPVGPPTEPPKAGESTIKVVGQKAYHWVTKFQKWEEIGDVVGQSDTASPNVTSEEADILEDIYGDEGPPRGGLAAAKKGEGAQRVGEPDRLAYKKITQGMSAEEQRAMYDFDCPFADIRSLQDRIKLKREQRETEAKAVSYVSEKERIQSDRETMEAKLRQEEYARQRQRMEAERQKKFEADEKERVKRLLEEDKREREARVRTCLLYVLNCV